jgi:putative FmdB family regulatory protein
MPTYQYQCQECTHAFEVFQSITASPVSTCPQCAGPVVRLISGGAGFLFKGSGFYTTDYRSEGYKKAEKADKDASSSSAPKADSPSGTPSSNSAAKAAS